MRQREKYRQVLRGCQGMTLVEVMVVMVIVAIISAIVYNVSLIQQRSAQEGGSVLEAAGSPTTGLELIKRDLALAGYGSLDLIDEEHQKNMAFLVRDGGAGNPDKLFLFDGSYIGIEELSYDFYGDLGYSPITSGSGTASITLEKLDLNNPDVEANEGVNVHSGDPNEFKGEIWQYAITNTSTYATKVAKITSIAGNTLTLDGSLTGDKAGPAVYYCVDADGSDTDCHPDGGPTLVLRRSSRNFGGRQPVAENIVDMQIAYQIGTTMYCDGVGPCPASPFYAGTINLIRISLIARINNVPEGKTVSAENGATWGADGAYRVFTVSIRPRNNIEF